MKKINNIFWLAIIILTVSCSRKPEQNNEIINEDITEWTSGENRELMISDVPVEFTGKNRNSHFGSLSPIENFTLNDLQSCSWQRNDVVLIFSQEGHYARMGRDEYVFGRYTFKDNTIYFSPSLNIMRFAEEYTIISLHYSNEMYYEGTPVLKNDDETVIFTANEAKRAKNGEIVKLHQYYCEKIWGESKINTNSILYSQPSTTSKNIFQEDYYGRKAKEVSVVKLAKTTIDNVVWFYLLLDFTGDELSDGGGPFYEGWLPEEYFE